jgi:hypothetical protein
MFVDIARTAVVPLPNADGQNMGDMIALNITALTHLSNVPLSQGQRVSPMVDTPNAPSCCRRLGAQIRSHRAK